MSTPPERPAKPAADTKSEDSVVGSLVRAQSLVQLALLLPAATMIGWAIGLGLDHWLKQDWIYIAGLVLGAVAGFVQLFRVVLALNKE